MKKYFILYFVFCAFLFPVIFISCDKKNETERGSSITLIDDAGRSVVFDKNPEKIVSLAPNLTEIIFSIGAGKKLNGVTTYCNYPDEALKIQKVADLVSVNYEALAGINPDVVFLTVEGNPKETFDKITGMGIKVFVSNPRNLSGILKTMDDFGKITGNSATANAEKKRILSKIDSLKNKIDYKLKPKALLLVSISPLMSVGENTYLHELLNMAGCINISATAKSNYPILNREEVLAKNPDFIFVPSDLTMNPNEVLKVYPEWNILSAAKNGNIKIINADLVQRPGSRIAEALEEIINKIY